MALICLVMLTKVFRVLRKSRIKVACLTIILRAMRSVFVIIKGMLEEDSLKARRDVQVEDARVAVAVAVAVAV
jgi:hypothetical protein